MNLSYKLLLNIPTKQRQFHLVISRFTRHSQIIFDENNLLHEEKPKGKIVVMKRKFCNKQASIIEWKKAEDVIKRLNLEYKCLYGPLQTSDKIKHHLTKGYRNQIIQHGTRIPIIEPPTLFKSNVMPDKEQKIDLTPILTFPLVNNCVYSTDKINKLNFLRKRLEFLCKGSTIPSVSLILQSTMPSERKEMLDKWKQNMITQMGEEGFEKYQSEIFAIGTSLHHSISSFLLSTSKSEEHIREENIGHWKSLKHILPKVGDVKLLEEFVTHPFLCYKGVVDCFARYRDQLVVIDWKASKKSKADIKKTYDHPLQIAAYVGALNFDPNYKYLANKGLIVIAYDNGMPATAHFLDASTMKYYWNKWLQRVNQFWEMRISESEIN